MEGEAHIEVRACGLATSYQFASYQFASLPVASLPVASLPVASCQFASLPVSQLPVASQPVSGFVGLSGVVEVPLCSFNAGLVQRFASSSRRGSGLVR